MFMAGAIIQWLKDELNLITSTKEIDVLAESVKDSHGVVIVPAFAGLGAPHWDQRARGTIFGLSRSNY